MTLAMTFATLRCAFINIKGGRGEDMHSLFNGLLSTYGEGNTRAMIVQATTHLADRNMRDVQAQPARLQKQS